MCLCRWMRLSVYLHEYVCVCLCMCACMWVFVYVWVRLFVYVFVCVFVSECVSVCVCLSVYAFVCVHQWGAGGGSTIDQSMGLFLRACINTERRRRQEDNRSLERKCITAHCGPTQRGFWELVSEAEWIVGVGVWGRADCGSWCLWGREYLRSRDLVLYS